MGMNGNWKLPWKLPSVIIPMDSHCFPELWPQMPVTSYDPVGWEWFWLVVFRPGVKVSWGYENPNWMENISTCSKVPNHQAVLVKHSETIYHALNKGWLKHVVETMVHSQFSSIPGDRCVGASASTDATPPAVSGRNVLSYDGDFSIKNSGFTKVYQWFVNLPHLSKTFGIQKLNPCFCWTSEKWWFNQHFQGLLLYWE